jgi:hypothetical protein
MSDLFSDDILARARNLFTELAMQDIPNRTETINALRVELRKYSPFASEPVDCVLWVPADSVHANDYNPNSVAPPEMRLLEHSVLEDGYTQPIVAWEIDGRFEVVDGFHRNRVGRECPKVRDRIHGYLPVSIINADRLDRGDRIAATIRHNRARGKHKVEAMSDIVVELKRRNWSDDRICRELGMDQDEVLRLCQITGLTELFSDQEFSKSWDVEGEVTETDFKELTDDVSTYGEESEKFRTVNTSDPGRIFHTWEKWECHKAGFYNNFPPDGMTKAGCEEAYRAFLADSAQFAAALESVVSTWAHSCEHYLTNTSMNRIAWLGQAAACYALGLPSVFRGGFHLLTETQQAGADGVALDYLNKWLLANSRPAVTMDAAYSGTRQSDIY